MVFTGSHNMNNKSPRYNDEVILQINDSEVHDGFKRYFFDLRAGAAITWQTSKFDVEPNATRSSTADDARKDDASPLFAESGEAS